MHDIEGLNLPSLEDIMLHHDAADSSLGGMSDSSTAAASLNATAPDFKWPMPTEALGFCHPALLDDLEPAMQHPDPTPANNMPATEQQWPWQQPSHSATGAAETPQQQHQQQQQLQPNVLRPSSRQPGASPASSSQQASNQQANTSAPSSLQLLSVPDFIQSVSERQHLAFAGAQGQQPPASTSDGPVAGYTSQHVPAGINPVKSSPPGSPQAESGDLSAANGALPKSRAASPEHESALKAGRKRTRPHASDAASRPAFPAIKAQTAGGYGIRAGLASAPGASAGPLESETQAQMPHSEQKDDCIDEVQAAGDSNSSDGSNKTGKPGQPEEDDSKKEVSPLIRQLLASANLLHLFLALLASPTSSVKSGGHACLRSYVFSMVSRNWSRIRRPVLLSLMARNGTVSAPFKLHIYPDQASRMTYRISAACKPHKLLA